MHQSSMSQYVEVIKVGHSQALSSMHKWNFMFYINRITARSTVMLKVYAPFFP